MNQFGVGVSDYQSIKHQVKLATVDLSKNVTTPQANNTRGSYLSAQAEIRHYSKQTAQDMQCNDETFDNGDIDEETKQGPLYTKHQDNQ